MLHFKDLLLSSTDFRNVFVMSQSRPCFSSNDFLIPQSNNVRLICIYKRNLPLLARCDHVNAMKERRVRRLSVQFSSMYVVQWSAFMLETVPTLLAKNAK